MQKNIESTNFFKVHLNFWIKKFKVKKVFILKSFSMSEKHFGSEKILGPKQVMGAKKYEPVKVFRVNP